MKFCVDKALVFFQKFSNLFLTRALGYFSKFIENFLGVSCQKIKISVHFETGIRYIEANILTDMTLHGIQQISKVSKAVN